MEKPEIRAIFRRLENHQDSLSQYQVEFIKGLKRYYSRYNKLSSRQLDALVSIDNLVYVKQV